VQDVLSHTGVDMSPWPTVKHFTSWLTLCPHNDKTGGKVIKSHTRKSQNRAAAALRMPPITGAQPERFGQLLPPYASQVGQSGGHHRHAHKLARIIYTMLKNHTEYQDLGAEQYENQIRERAVKNLKRKAKQLGFDLIPATT